MSAPIACDAFNGPLRNPKTFNLTLADKSGADFTFVCRRCRAIFMGGCTFRTNQDLTSQPIQTFPCLLAIEKMNRCNITPNTLIVEGIPEFYKVSFQEN
jgi:hypothetical protein